MEHELWEILKAINGKLDFIIAKSGFVEEEPEEETELEEPEEEKPAKKKEKIVVKK